MFEKLVALAPLVPLAQTLLWVLLVIALVAWFRASIQDLLEAIRRRIQSGSSVKAGWFELSELRPQPAEQQKSRALEESTESGFNASGQRADASLKTTSSKALLAEDLALRAFQADIGIPLSRQVSAGPDAGFDAAFVRDGALNVVEVKFFTGPANPGGLRRTLDRLVKALERVHSRNVRVVLVLVFQQREDAYLPKNAFDDAFKEVPMSVDIRTFSMPELRERFGIAPDDA